VIKPAERPERVHRIRGSFGLDFEPGFWDDMSRMSGEKCERYRSILAAFEASGLLLATRCCSSSHGVVSLGIPSDCTA